MGERDRFGTQDPRPPSVFPSLFCTHARRGYPPFCSPILYGEGIWIQGNPRTQTHGFPSLFPSGRTSFASKRADARTCGVRPFDGRDVQVEAFDFALRRRRTRAVRQPDGAARSADEPQVGLHRTRLDRTVLLKRRIVSFRKGTPDPIEPNASGWSECWMKISHHHNFRSFFFCFTGHVRGKKAIGKKWLWIAYPGPCP